MLSYHADFVTQINCFYKSAIFQIFEEIKLYTYVF